MSCHGPPSSEPWPSTPDSALAYALLGDASPALVGFIQAFAAGAILTMLPTR